MSLAERALGRTREHPHPDRPPLTPNQLRAWVAAIDHLAGHGLTAIVPGDVPVDHPGLTPRVLDAIAAARRRPRRHYPITDADGPHRHHWVPILWVCRGCGAFDE